MKMRNNCFGCSYHRLEIDEEEVPYHYCHDRDCRVDPHEPECNYE